jgi:acetyl-CoA C-acetyltransferase
VNVYGGACAQGHPIGSTGSRLIVTLAHALMASSRQRARGIAALCASAAAKRPPSPWNGV